MAAGAIMRAEKISENDALRFIENGSLSVHARLLSKCRIKSHLLITITKFKVDKGKRPTDALGRQFVFAHEYESIFLSPDEDVIDRLGTAFYHAPIYFGDSESLATVSEIEKMEIPAKPGNGSIQTFYYTPLSAFTELSLPGTVFYVHEGLQNQSEDESKKKSKKKQLPLIEYIFPITGNPSEYQPGGISGILNPDYSAYAVDDHVIVRKN
jgi:hypothetical protein